MARESVTSLPLKAGAAMLDITPAMGTQIAGDIGRRRPAEVVIEPLYAHALVLEAGARKLCIVSLDLCVMGEPWLTRIRQAAAERFGFDPQAVLLHSVQNHAAPALGHEAMRPEFKRLPEKYAFMRGGDDRYHEFATQRIIAVIGQANAALELARIGSAAGIEGRVAFNRRFVMRDGSVKTHPRAGDPNILYAEGPIDPELGVTVINTPALKTVAMILHHTCHPTHGYPHRYISHDWPGAWAEGVRGIFGGVPVVLNGCCGNIHHANHLDPKYVDDYRRMGALLTETTLPLVRGVRPVSEVALDYRIKRIRLPVRPFDAKDLKAARKLLKDNPDPKWLDAEKTAAEWDWVYAMCLLDLYEVHKDNPWFDYDVQVLRAGDTAFVALGGEPFVEGQLRIKLESPVRHTVVAHMAGPCAGYIPTRQAFERKGYETRMANWSKLAPEALDLVADAAIKLLREVFADKAEARR